MAGFDAREFPAVPRAFRFAQVSSAVPGTIRLEYRVIGGGGYLFLSQGIDSEFPPFTGSVMESAIEPVKMSDSMGEFVAGNFFYGGELKQPTWSACCRLRLRWTDDGRWYELDMQSAMEQTDYLTKEVMIEMAAELVS